MSEPDQRMVLMIVILNQPQLLDDLLTGFLDLGVRGATVVESRGMGQIIRQEMPIFAGLAGMFGEHTGSRMVMSVMPDTLAESVFKLVEEIAGALDAPNTPVCFTLPIDAMRGIR